ncbi:hypothetical protein [Pseudofulvibacter geojedonensis]|uniref:Uncharacterized protein n=1 Tax=Pseudofulvibacter geojedonensis TaxID=1123758 RepID=A0ABW3I175_9FLAO
MEEKIVGEYYLEEDIYGVGSNLNLTNNGVFEYRWQEGLINGKTIGKFVVLGDNIVLNSDYQPDDDEFKDNFKLLKKELNQLDSIKVRIVDNKKQAFEGAMCMLKRKDSVVFFKETDFKGEVLLPKIKVDSLCAYYLAHDYVSISMDNFNYDDISIELEEKNPQFEFYHFFSNKKLKFKNNKLIGSKEKFKKVK